GRPRRRRTASRARSARRPGERTALVLISRTSPVRKPRAILEHCRGARETAPFVLQSLVRGADKSLVSVTVSPPVRILAICGLVGAMAIGGGLMLLGRHGSGTAAAPVTIKHHP